LFFVIFSVATGISQRLWPNQMLFFIYLAVILAVLSWISQVMNQITDAYGCTVPAELSRIMQRVIGLVLIITLFFFDALSLKNFFFYNYITLLILICFFYRVMSRHGYVLKNNWRLNFYEIRKYVKEFYKFSHPLFVLGLIGMLAALFDRWFLQRFSGSIEQGFFGLSIQIGVLCFLFTSAMTPLIIREFSIAYDKNNLSFMAELFRKHIPLLYSITAFFSCFIVVNADKVTLMVGGGKFRAATLAVAIMAFYPIHQTYGQLSGSLLYVTGQTKLYRNIGVIFLVLGLPLTYFLIAPKKDFGLDLGATGLAIKTVVLQFVAVNVQLYFNSRLLRLKFWKYVGHQIVSVVVLLASVLFISFGIDLVFANKLNMFFRFTLSGLLYSVLVFVLLCFLPAIFGLKKAAIKDVMGLLKGINV